MFPGAHSRSPVRRTPETGSAQHFAINLKFETLAKCPFEAIYRLNRVGFMVNTGDIISSPVPTVFLQKDD